ncbi:MAG: substrate-binding domain-containing protein [Pyrinomonadaceae bacterium]
MRKLFLPSLAFFCLFIAGCEQPSTTNTAPPTQGAATKKYTIAVVPKGTTHEFWKAIHAGAIKAAQELTQQGTPTEVIWKGPLREDDREQQIQVIESFTSQGISGIVLAPLDSRALVRPVEEAGRAGIPTIVIDSALESDKILSFVATDNLKGGELSADRMAELLGGKGKALLLRYQEGSASTTDREIGFLKQLKAKYPEIELISSDQYAGATRDTAKRAAENLLNRYGNELQGIFVVNESATAGMLLALQDMGKAGQINLIGFDATDSFIDAMRSKQLHGFVVQKPFNMGYLGVKTMVEHLQGKPIERRVDTGVTMITPANLDSADTQEILHPPIDQYLK